MEGARVSAVRTEGLPRGLLGADPDAQERCLQRGQGGVPQPRAPLAEGRFSRHHLGRLPGRGRRRSRVQGRLSGDDEQRHHGATPWPDRPAPRAPAHHLYRAAEAEGHARAGRRRRDPNRTKLLVLRDDQCRGQIGTASNVLDGLVPDPTNGADHYHTIEPPAGTEAWPPDWAATMRETDRFGGHVFYDSRSPR